jgi:hypothetical protein
MERSPYSLCPSSLGSRSSLAAWGVYGRSFRITLRSEPVDTARSFKPFIDFGLAL